MTRKLVYTLTLMVLIAMFVSVPVARADSVNLSFLSAIQTGNSGQTLSFYGTIQNLTGATLYLNGDGLNADPLLFTDDSTFVLGAPFILGAGDSYSGLLFTATIDPTAVNGSILGGTLAILGGADEFASDELSAAGGVPFAVQVPEPASMMLLGAGFVGLAGVICRKK